MNFDEYLEKFKEALELTEKLEEANNGHNNAIFGEIFNKRQQILEELAKTDFNFQVTEKDIELLKSIKATIQKKNNAIIRQMKIKQAVIKQELLETKQESKLIEAYKCPVDMTKSVFDIKE